VLSEGPFLQRNTWSLAFKATGSFQNFVSSEANYNILKMKEVARHVSPEAREVAEWYMQKFNEKLIILGFLQMIGKWPCYLSCPIFELHAPNEIKKIKIRARHEDILNCKSIFDNKVGVMNIFKAY